MSRPTRHGCSRLGFEKTARLGAEKSRGCSFNTLDGTHFTCSMNYRTGRGKEELERVAIAYRWGHIELGPTNSEGEG